MKHYLLIQETFETLSIKDYILQKLINAQMKEEPILKFLATQRNLYLTQTKSKPCLKADCKTFLKNTFTPLSTKTKKKEDQDINPFTARHLAAKLQQHYSTDCTFFPKLMKQSLSLFPIVQEVLNLTSS